MVKRSEDEKEAVPREVSDRQHKSMYSFKSGWDGGSSRLNEAIREETGDRVRVKRREESEAWISS